MGGTTFGSVASGPLVGVVPVVAVEDVEDLATSVAALGFSWPAPIVLLLPLEPQPASSAAVASAARIGTARGERRERKSRPARTLLLAMGSQEGQGEEEALESFITAGSLAECEVFVGRTPSEPLYDSRWTVLGGEVAVPCTRNPL